MRHKYARRARWLRRNAVLALLQRPARAQRPRAHEVADLGGAVVARPAEPSAASAPSVALLEADAEQPHVDRGGGVEPVGQRAHAVVPVGRRARSAGTSTTPARRGGWPGR